MKIKLFYLAALVCAIWSNQVLADSPLTSTPFSNAYQDKKIVQYAAKSNGQLDTYLMNYLFDQNNPLVLKLALINQLSWDINGKNNADKFTNYLKRQGVYTNIHDFTYKNERSDLMICLAYLKALDNYFEVAEARALAQNAQKLNPLSYSLNIVAALIDAQYLFDQDWCKSYYVTYLVKTDPLLDNDMRRSARHIIFDYMDLYEDDCQ